MCSRCGYRLNTVRTTASLTSYALEGSLAEGTSYAGPLLRTDTNGDGNQSISIKGLYTPGGDLSITPAVLYQRYSSSDTSTFIPAAGLYNTYAAVPGADTDSMLLPSLTVKKGLGIRGFHQRHELPGPDGATAGRRHILQFCGHRRVRTR